MKFNEKLVKEAMLPSDTVSDKGEIANNNLISSDAFLHIVFKVVSSFKMVKFKIELKV